MKQTLEVFRTMASARSGSPQKMLAVVTAAASDLVKPLVPLPTRGGQTAFLKTAQRAVF